MTSIYDLLNKTSIDDLTVSNLDAATGRTAIDRQTIEFWQGVMTLSHVMKAARTAPHGLPIAESGDVDVRTIANGANDTIKATGTEVWMVHNVDLDNCTMAFMDGAGNISPVTTDDQGRINPSLFPIYISATCFLAFSNGSGSEQTPSIAYHKVSL